LVRAVLDQSEAAREWTTRAETKDVHALAPDLIWAEVTHAMRRLVRAGSVTPTAGTAGLALLVGLPLESRSVRPLAALALDRALSTGLSAYDACYLVLAEAADATLVTADVRLAAAAGKAELIA
jgi:predicted nucleic acid-binding protein